jgi:hypothetical protein
LKNVEYFDAIARFIHNREYKFNISRSVWRTLPIILKFEKGFSNNKVARSIKK